VLAGVLIRQTVIAGSIDSGGRSLAEVRVYSATGFDFLSRNTRHGVEAFVEVGPGKVLSGLVRQIDRDVRTFNVSDAESLRSTIESI